MATAALRTLPQDAVLEIPVAPSEERWAAMSERERTQFLDTAFAALSQQAERPFEELRLRGEDAKRRVEEERSRAEEAERRAQEERSRADEAERRAEEAARLAEAERARAEALEARLAALLAGTEPG